MAGSPLWKVYIGKEYVASCKYVEDAAAILALHGGGSAGENTIRHGHGAASDAVYADGVDGVASESFDEVAAFVYNRQAARDKEWMRKYGGRSPHPVAGGQE